MDPRQVCRRGNVLILRAARGRTDELIGFVCECADEDCVQSLTLAPREFEALTAEEGRYVVIRGHEDFDVEDVVRAGPGYAVVEGSCGFEDRQRELNAR